MVSKRVRKLKQELDSPLKKRSPEAEGLAQSEHLASEQEPVFDDGGFTRNEAAVHTAISMPLDSGSASQALRLTGDENLHDLTATVEAWHPVPLKHDGCGVDHRGRHSSPLAATDEGLKATEENLLNRSGIAAQEPISFVEDDVDDFDSEIVDQRAKPNQISFKTRSKHHSVLEIPDCAVSKLVDDIERRQIDDEPDEALEDEDNTDGEDRPQDQLTRSGIAGMDSSLTPNTTFESEPEPSVLIQAPAMSGQTTRLILSRGLQNTSLKQVKEMFLRQMQSSVMADQLVVQVGDKVLEAVDDYTTLAVHGLSDGATLILSTLRPVDLKGLAGDAKLMMEPPQKSEHAPADEKSVDMAFQPLDRDLAVKELHGKVLEVCTEAKRLECEGQMQESVALYQQAGRLALSHVQMHPGDKEKMIPMLDMVSKRVRKLKQELDSPLKKRSPEAEGLAQSEHLASEQEPVFDDEV
jgi:hypothetical protein